jgi:hypothetical protein
MSDNHWCSKCQTEVEYGTRGTYAKDGPMHDDAACLVVVVSQRDEAVALNGELRGLLMNAEVQRDAALADVERLTEWIENVHTVVHRGRHECDPIYLRSPAGKASCASYAVVALLARLDAATEAMREVLDLLPATRQQVEAGDSRVIGAGRILAAALRAQDEGGGK